MGCKPLRLGVSMSRDVSLADDMGEMLNMQKWIISQ